MVRKALFLLPVFVAVLAASQWRELSRYVKLRQMSSGDGHPEHVAGRGTPFYRRAQAAVRPTYRRFRLRQPGGPQTP